MNTQITKTRAQDLSGYVHGGLNAAEILTVGSTTARALNERFEPKLVICKMFPLDV